MIIDTEIVTKEIHDIRKWSVLENGMYRFKISVWTIDIWRFLTGRGTHFRWAVNEGRIGIGGGDAYTFDDAIQKIIPTICNGY